MFSPQPDVHHFFSYSLWHSQFTFDLNWIQLSSCRLLDAYSAALCSVVRICKLVILLVKPDVLTLLGLRYHPIKIIVNALFVWNSFQRGLCHAYIDAYVCRILAGKTSSHATCQETLITVVLAHWNTVDWSWPKKVWNWCAWAGFHLKKKKKKDSAGGD